MKVAEKHIIGPSKMFSNNKKKFKKSKNKFLLSRDAIHGFKYLMDENLTFYER